MWEGRSLGDELSFGVSAGVKVNDVFVIGPELFGGATVTGADAFSQCPDIAGPPDPEPARNGCPAPPASP